MAGVGNRGGGVDDAAPPAMPDGISGIQRERDVTTAFLSFAREHKEIYRIIDEAEFVDPNNYRAHYENAAGRIAARLDQAARDGDIAPGDNEVRAWALMGMNVFLGMRFGVWDDSRNPAEIAAVIERLLRNGIAPPHRSET